MSKSVYDGKCGVGGIGEIQAPYAPDKAPTGRVIQGGDLRGGSKGGGSKGKK